MVAAFRPDVFAGQHANTDDAAAGSEAVEPNPHVAAVAYRVLQTWHMLPATSTGAILDGDTLADWAARAEMLLTQVGRAEIGLYCIGQAIAGKVTDDDGTWPSAPVRQVLEARAHPALEEGLHIARVNQRGVTTRGIHEGGQQERELANQYREWADRVRSQWPRTAALLDAIAERYRAEGREQDQRRDR